MQMTRLRRVHVIVRLRRVHVIVRLRHVHVRVWLRRNVLYGLHGTSVHFYLGASTRRHGVTAQTAANTLYRARGARATDKTREARPAHTATPYTTHIACMCSFSHFCETQPSRALSQ